MHLPDTTDALAVELDKDHVNVMFEGRIVKQGGPELVAALEERGYGWIREEVEAAA